MNTFDFRLVFSLPAGAPAPESFVDALYEAGCDDALVGTGEKGTIALDFSRQSTSATEALASAIANVKSAIPGVELVEASPDLVSLSDLARCFGFSRQNMRKYYAGREDFPKPAHIGSTNLWHLYDVAGYFQEQKRQKVPETLVEVSAETLRQNFKAQMKRHEALLA